MLKNKTILVTGGAGFIGSHLCEYLINKRSKVIVVDDLSSGFEENLKAVIEDINFYNQSTQTFNFSSLQSLDAVVHLSAQTSVKKSIDDFLNSSTSNLLGLLKVIDFCKNRQVPLVLASSAAVYGNLGNGDDSEEKFELLSPYAADKYSGELYTKLSNKIYGTRSISLRFFNVYGPRQDPNNPYSGVISKFIHQMNNNKKVTIYGGSQTRDFIYVLDAVLSISAALNVLMNSHISESINVLTTRSVSINELFKLLSSLTSYNKEPIYESQLAGDPQKSSGKVEKIKRILKLDPSSFTILEEGLENTLR